MIEKLLPVRSSFTLSVPIRCSSTGLNGKQVRHTLGVRNACAAPATVSVSNCMIEVTGATALGRQCSCRNRQHTSPETGRSVFQRMCCGAAATY